MRKYIYGPGIDQPICMIDVNDSNAVYYYHYDALGSVVALSDSAGDTVQLYEYTVFGQVAAEDPNHPNPFLFTGRRFDTETGLYYYRARYYNPYIGRFLQTDPVGDGMNAYPYCGNNPINRIDPTGTFALPCLQRWIFQALTQVDYDTTWGHHVDEGWLSWKTLVGWQFNGSGATLTITGETFDLLLAESPYLKVFITHWLVAKAGELVQALPEDEWFQAQYINTTIDDDQLIIGQGRGFLATLASLSGKMLTLYLINEVGWEIEGTVSVWRDDDEGVYGVNFDVDLVLSDRTDFHPKRSLGHLVADGVPLYLQWVYNNLVPLPLADAQPYTLRFYKGGRCGSGPSFLYKWCYGYGPSVWYKMNDDGSPKSSASGWNIPWW